MEKADRVREAFDQNYGIISTAELAAIKVDYYGIQKLIKGGTLEKIKNGYYRIPEHWNNSSEANLIAQLFPDGVLCMYTALFYYGYTDRTPLHWDIAVDKDSSKSRFNLDYPYVHPFYVEASQLTFGVSIGDFVDCKIKIFDRDRLICDCLKYENKMDRETFNKAIQGYVNDSQKNIQKLLDYAKRRRVYEKVKQLIGVWL